MPVGEVGQRLRVLCVVWRAGSSGGVPRFQQDLARAVAEDRRVDLAIVSVRPSTWDDHNELGRHAQLHFLGITGGLDLRSRLRAIRRLRRTLRAERPDVVHVHSGLGWLVLASGLRRSGRHRVVVQVHDPPQTGRHSRESDALERWAAVRGGWTAVVDCRTAAEQLAEAWRVAPGLIRTASLGIDHDRYVASADTGSRLRDREGIAPDAVVVTYVARMAPSKRVDRFVELAALVGRQVEGHHVIFVAVGTGSLLDQIRDQASAVEADVRLPGYVSDDDLLGWYAASDVFVSTSESEGFGLAVAEAMACGIPVAALSTAGFNDLVAENVTGKTVAQDDLDGLASQVRSLIVDGQRRRREGLAGRQRIAETFSLAAMGRRYVDLWSRVALGR